MNKNESQIPSSAWVLPFSERRRLPRLPLESPAIVVPIRPNLRPDWKNRREAHCLDLSATGLGLACKSNDLAGPIVVGVEGSRVKGYTGLELRYREHLPGEIRFGGAIGGVGEAILNGDHLSLCYRYGPNKLDLVFSQSVLDAWAEVGVLQQTGVDLVQLCPRCLGLPTFRPGCRNCGSARFTNDQLIHHFACAFVGPVQDFEHHGELRCPKCRTRGLIVGRDFEYVVGPYRCLDCHWHDMQLEQVGQCLQCRLRFPVGQAFLKEIPTYHVDRLDPLVVCQAS
ncbi:MAG: hypothetical protein KatS3mg105_2115 [Gemmatales bacterium]|nr:MAG: hypothetical protein KatS3mg105_2115 [Gemmatales bacterium]